MKVAFKYLLGFVACSSGLACGSMDEGFLDMSVLSIQPLIQDCPHKDTLQSTLRASLDIGAGDYPTCPLQVNFDEALNITATGESCEILYVGAVRPISINFSYEDSPSKLSYRLALIVSWIDLRKKTIADNKLPKLELSVDNKRTAQIDANKELDLIIDPTLCPSKTMGDDEDYNLDCAKRWAKYWMLEQAKKFGQSASFDLDGDESEISTGVYANTNLKEACDGTLVQNP